MKHIFSEWGVRLSRQLLVPALLAGTSVAGHAQTLAGPAGITAGIRTWLDASDVNADGLPNNPADGVAIATWADKSGKNQPGQQLSSNSAATLASGPGASLNGNPVMRFAAGKVYNFAGIDIRAAAMEDLTIITVYRQGNVGGTGLWGNDNGNWDRFMYTAFNGTNGIASRGPGQSPPNTDIVGSGVPGNTYLFTAVYDGAVSGTANNGPVNGSAFYFNGTLLGNFTDKTDPTAAQTSLRLGFDGDNGFFVGDIAEFIVYDRVLGQCEIQAINSYLSQKYGITFSVASVTASGSTSLCAGGSVTLTAASAASYQWQRDGQDLPGATSATYVATQAGSYTVTVPLNGCGTATSAPTVVTVNPQPTLSYSVVDAGCTGTPGSLTVRPLIGTAPFTYSINGGAFGSNATFGNLTAGTYQLRVRDSKGCESVAVAATVRGATSAPVASAKNVTVQLDAAGNATVTGAQVNNNSVASCGTPTLAVSPSSFTCANLGPNAVTLTVTDAGGRTATATATVTVVDNVAPVALAQNLTVQLDANGTASITAAQINNGSSDNCGTPALTVAPSTFSCANVGANTVTLTATDASGNTNTTTATVTVQSALALLETHTDVSCFGAATGSINLQVVAGNNATYAWTGPNGFTATTQNLTNLAAGNYTATVTVNGCSATQTVTLTQPADQAPVANPDQLNTTACAPLTITPAMLLGNDTDPQGGTLQIAEVLTPSSGTIAANTNGTYTYTPAPGFTGTATFTYVAKKNDNTVAYSGNGHFYEFVSAPGICWTAAKTAAEARTYRGLTGYLATITSAGENAFAASKLQGNGWLGASDAAVEGEWRWMTGPEAGQLFWRGAANGTGAGLGYSSWDGGEPNNSGNEDYAHFYIGSGRWNDLGNCPGTSWISGYVVEYGGLDACTPRLTASAVATVTVSGPVPTPVALTRNATLNLSSAGTATLPANLVNNGSSAACGIASISVSPSTFTCANVGPNTVTLTVTGIAGGTATATAIVTVVDVTAPVARTKPATIYLDANGQATLSPADVDNSSSDNCGIATRTLSKMSFTCANTGANTVTLTVADAGGRTASATAAVTVVDNIAPTVTCQPFTVLLNANGQASIGVADVVAASSDNCAITSLTVSPNTFAAANVGANTVVVTARDAAGNVSTCQATVTVVEPAPVAICQPTTLQLDANGQATLAAAQVDGGSYSLVGLSDISVSPSTFTCANVGPNTVTLTVTNRFGRTATCQTTVTVEDAVAPVALAQNVTVQLDASGAASVTAAQVNNNSTDNCGIASVTVAPNTFSCANTGANTVTLTVTDNSGHVSTASAVVTVVDNLLPTISAPAAVVVSTDAGQCSATNVALGTATAADNCSASVTNNAPAIFPKGATTVTWTARDAAGNVATATQTVIVNDAERPTITAPVAIVVSTDAGQCSASNVALGSATAADNCTGVTVTNNAPASFAKGTTTVTWTATDASGNIATATQLVTVNDTERPVLAALANLSVNAPATTCGAVVTFATPATDNCGVSVVASPASGSTFAVGTTTVNVTATDAAGNKSTGSFTVTVRDVTAPAALAKTVDVTLVNGQATVTAAQLDNGSTDACGIRTMSLSKTSFDCSNIGANPVTLTVTDNNGNTSTASGVVNVRGDVPVVSIAATPASVNYSAKSIVVYLGYGSQTATLTASSGALTGVRYVWTAAPGLSTLNGASTVFTPTAEGTFTFTVTATSATGCSSTAQVNVYVEDVRCGNSNSNSLNEKVQICHNGQTICVSINSLQTHLSHGDKIGDCSVSFPRGTAEAAPAPATRAAANELLAFPNPVSENATVQFRTAQDGPAQVVVYNELGQRVAVLFDGAATAGQQYSLTLKGRNLASGLYVCRLVTNGKTETLRLTVVR